MQKLTSLRSNGISHIQFLSIIMFPNPNKWFGAYRFPSQFRGMDSSILVSLLDHVVIERFS